MPHHQNFLDDQRIFDACDDLYIATTFAAGRIFARNFSEADTEVATGRQTAPGTFGTVAGVIARLFSLRANRPEAITQISVDQALVTLAAKQPAPAL
jgi:hypothetical protein